MFVCFIVLSNILHIYACILNSYICVQHACFRFICPFSCSSDVYNAKQGIQLRIGFGFCHPGAYALVGDNVNKQIKFQRLVSNYRKNQAGQGVCVKNV